jgi:hypothetical protein
LLAATLMARSLRFAEDILWHVPGRGPLSGDYHGHAQVLEFFGHFMRLSGGSFRIQLDEILAKRDLVVALCTEERPARWSQLVIATGPRLDCEEWPRLGLQHGVL